jgi:hypothetical protein
MFLSVPLPAASKRTYHVTLFRADNSRPMVYAFLLSNQASMATLLGGVSAKRQASVCVWH